VCDCAFNQTSPSIFKRYDIVERAELAEAAARLDAKQKAESAHTGEFGQSLGRDDQNSTTSDAVADTQRAAIPLIFRLLSIQFTSNRFAGAGPSPQLRI